jgi:HlyD family secretion protein
MNVVDRHYGDTRRRNDYSRSRDFGPQGQALILELQRLRRAFDEEADSPRRPHAAPRHGDAKQGPRRRPGPLPKRRQQSRMREILDACVQQIGLKKTPTIERRLTPSHHLDSLSVRNPGSTSPSRQPLEMNLARLARDMGAPLRVSPPISPESVDATRPDPAKHEGKIDRLVTACRTRLMTGLNFVIYNDGLEPAADCSLLLKVNWSFDQELRSGLRVLLIAGVLGGGWAFFMPLAGAVVVPGNLVVQSNVKTIQHPTGGVVAEIEVQNGSHVAAGDLLVRLDATQLRANQRMVSKRLDEERVKLARLSAERDGLSIVGLPAELASRANDETVDTLLVSEQSLFRARLTARQSQNDLLQSKVAQLTDEIAGLETQVNSRAKQIELIQGELTGVQDLYEKHLVPLTRLTALQREAARLDGERGQLISSIAETKSKIGEAQLQIVRLDQDFRTDVVKEIGEAQGKEAELSEREIAARDQFERVEIRAPTSGVVHQLAAHTINGVIKAGDTIMEIVPDTEDLQLEARLQPQDIDHVRTGQTAFVRFSAFNQRTTPQLTGSVSYVSADTSHDQQTNASYFTVRVTLPDDERRKLAGQQLVPGMPAEVFMQTGSRTMMSYLFKPIVDQMRRAFIEQ